MRLQKLDLTMEDMAVMLPFAILMSDRDGLQRTDQVEKMQDKMLPVSFLFSDLDGLDVRTVTVIKVPPVVGSL